MYIIALLGVAVFAISGALAAGRKSLDWIGVLALATATALGGGTLRDVLLNREVFWVADPMYFWVIIFASIITIVYTRFFKPPYKALLIADAFGLALFTILGAQIAEAQEVSPLIVALMGVLTGVAGGILRDMFVGETPLLFQANESLYSVAALSGVAAYIFLNYLQCDILLCMGVGMVMIIVIRFMAIVWHIKLPAYKVE